ncbi:hypothetical protein LTR85_009059 [Meristemomyces frigidus]|nr:hypothetical protein LTR85_009059 [Meristemomyces frigidus]
MAVKEHPTLGDGEVYRPAFPTGYPHISYGLPLSQACVKHVSSTFNASRVYIIASGSLSRNTDYVQQLEAALGERVVGVRRGMTPHTLWSEILQITAEAKKGDADLLLTLGAGSLTDAAKIIALAMANNATTFGELDKLHIGNQQKQLEAVKPPTVPIISIPTSLSGGEYSHRGGGTNDQTHQKHSFSHPTKGPALVILDPQLTTTTPDSIWLSTGIRAVDHCVEGMCSLQSTPASDVDAAKGLRLLVPGLLRCKKDKFDLDARLSCQMGVVEAMKAVNQHNVAMGASHGIGHQLGPLGVGHGETSCILLPAVCRYNVEVNGDQQRKVADALWSEPEVEAVFKARGLTQQAQLSDLLDAVIRALGLPRSLQDVGVEEEKLELLAENSLHDRWCATNPRPLTEKGQVMEILKMVMA